MERIVFRLYSTIILSIAILYFTGIDDIVWRFSLLGFLVFPFLIVWGMEDATGDIFLSSIVHPFLAERAGPNEWDLMHLDLTFIDKLLIHTAVPLYLIFAAQLCYTFIPEFFLKYDGSPNCGPRGVYC